MQRKLSLPSEFCTLQGIVSTVELTRHHVCIPKSDEHGGVFRNPKMMWSICGMLGTGTRHQCRIIRLCKHLWCSNFFANPNSFVESVEGCENPRRMWRGRPQAIHDRNKEAFVNTKTWRTQEAILNGGLSTYRFCLYPGRKCLGIKV